MRINSVTLVIFTFTAFGMPAIKAQTNVGLGGGGAIFAPVISPSDPTLMFVACDMTGLYRTADGGTSWTMLNQRDVKGFGKATSAQDARGFSVAFDPSRPNFVLGYHPTRGLMQSVSGRGANGTWTPFGISLPAGITVTAAAFSNEAQSQLLIGTTTGLYDGAGTPQTLPQGASQDILKIVWVGDPATGAQLPFVATSTGVYQRTGTTWNSTGTFTFPIRDLAGGSDGTHYALYVSFVPIVLPDGTVEQGGISRYASNGANPRTWQQVASNGPSDQCFAFVGGLLGVSASQPDTAYATVPSTCSGGSVVQTAVYKGTFTLNPSTNQWTWSWVGVYRGFQNDATTNLIPSGWIEKEPTASPPGLGWGFGGVALGFAASPANSSTAIFTNFGAVHVTADGGNTWGQRYTIDRGAGNWQTNGVDVTGAWNYYVNNSTHFIANTDIGLSRSVDGVRWSYVGPDNSNGVHNAARDWHNFYELAFDSTPGSSTVWAAVSSHHNVPFNTEMNDVLTPIGQGVVLVSTDNGAHWITASDSTLPSAPVASLVRRVESSVGVLYASVWRQGVWKSTPTPSGIAGSWSRVGSFADSHVYQLRVNGPANDLYLSVTLAITGYTPPPGAPAGYCSPPKIPADCTPIYKTGGLYKLDPVTSDWVSLTCATPTTCIDPVYPMDFTFDPTDPNVTFMAAADDHGAPGKGGLWKILVDSSHPPAQLLKLSQIDTNPNAFVVGFAPTFVAGTLYVATITHGTWQSRDKGMTWSPAFTNVPFLNTQRLATPATGDLFLTTFGGGVWNVTESNMQVIMITDPTSGRPIPLVLPL